MTTVDELKTLLIDTLQKQIENGIQVPTKRGEVVTIDAPAPVLAVAAKVIKDWAHEVGTESADARKVENLQNYLNKRRPDLKVAN